MTLFRTISASLLLSAATTLAAVSAFAGEAAPALKKPTANECIHELKKWPSKKTGEKINISGNYPEYELTQIPSLEASRNFTTCIDLAIGPPLTESEARRLEHPYTNDGNGFLRITNPSGHTLYQDFVRTSFQGVKFFYTDNYQRKYLFDLDNAIAYEMKRIALDGSIESLGRWNGNYIEDPRIRGCRNSYGDPCGTQYQLSIGEGNVPFYQPKQDVEIGQ
ncbi:hypothetical protein NRB16_01430 [Pseudomonas sp. LJDD11]|uniref:hypothetical protein n=1 Tax=Pseudomonas sp. LJDD11 TaxID=2931984 RepID=UPI00211B7891|nr:hypothetical protein [Pseudomonas sp. LJDD11]MCQ9422188.1 hypothetical protein [Pseudomonas sp. LJDD11]